MANISSAFGYSVYILPLNAANVDVDFTGVTSGIGTLDTDFINTTLTAAITGLAIGYNNTTNKLTIGAVDEGGDGDQAAATGDSNFILKGLTNASLETDTNSEEVLTYDDETLGFNLQLPTSKTWSISLAGVADFQDTGYKAIRLIEQNTVAGNQRVKFARVGPTGTDETIYGYGTLQGYTESIEAGSIVTWEMSITGYGPYRIEVDNP